MGVVLMPPNLRPQNTVPPGVKLMPPNLRPAPPASTVASSPWVALGWLAAIVLGLMVFKVPKPAIKWFVGIVVLAVVITRWESLKGFLPVKG